MQPLGEGFGQPVGQGLGENARVVVVIALERGAHRVEAVPCRHREGAHPVGLMAVLGSHVIGQRQVGAPRPLLELLPQPAQHRAHLRAILTRVDLDVVADRVGGEEADHRARLHQPLGDDALEQRLRVREQLAGGLADR